MSEQDPVKTSNYAQWPLLRIITKEEQAMRTKMAHFKLVNTPQREVSVTFLSQTVPRKTRRPIQKWLDNLRMDHFQEKSTNVCESRLAWYVKFISCPTVLIRAIGALQIEMVKLLCWQQVLSGAMMSNKINRV